MFALTLLAGLSPAYAAEVVVEGTNVRVDGQLVVTEPVAPRGAVATAEHLYVLTADGRVETWVWSPAPSRVAVAAAPDAVGLFLVGSEVWARVEEIRGVPLASLPAAGEAAVESGAGAAGAVVGTPGVAGVGKVVRVSTGQATVNRGRKDGLQVGSEVRFFGTETVTVPSLSGEGVESRDVETVVAAGRVKVVEDDRALVDLGRGGRTTVGDRVEPKENVYNYPIAPERLPGIREAGVVVRPMLGLETVGVGFINEAWLTWSMRSPWYVSGRISPIGVGVSTDGNPLTIAALASGGYESRYFSVGLGAGWSMLNGYSDSRYGAMDDGGVSIEFQDVRGAAAVVQEARLGARDGIFVSIRNTFLLVPTYTYTYPEGYYYDYYAVTAEEDGKEFTFGGIAMDLQVPTGDRTDLFADFGTGSAGATWVEGGVSTWLRGNGDIGSVGVRVGAGYGSVRGYIDDTSVELYGPMVSVGARYRF